ncbi:SpoIIE family protein phosphatase [Streptomyces kaempferi]
MELELPEGTLLALYTDGLVESRDDDIDVGLDRLGAALAETSSSLEDLCSQVIEFLPTQSPADDVTLLLARTRGLEPAQVASWELPNERRPSASPGRQPPVSSANGGLSVW